MHKMLEYIDDELKDLEKKVEKEGRLSRTEIEDGKNLAKFKMAILTNKAMESEGYSGNVRHYPEPHTVSYGRKRDSMGRYSRDSFLDELYILHDKAPDEKHKKAIKRMIEDMESE